MDDLDSRNTKKLNGRVITGGVFAAVATHVLWANISRSPLWYSFVAAGVVFVAYCCEAYNIVGQIKKSEYIDDAERYWKDVYRVLGVFGGTAFLTACGVAFLILLARYL